MHSSNQVFIVPEPLFGYDVLLIGMDYNGNFGFELNRF